MTSRHDKKRQTMRDTMEAKTGRSIEGWLAHLAADGPADSSRWQAWLKEQGLGHFQARMVVGEARSRE